MVVWGRASAPRQNRAGRTEEPLAQAGAIVEIEYQQGQKFDHAVQIQGDAVAIKEGVRRARAPNMYQILWYWHFATAIRGLSPDWRLESPSGAALPDMLRLYPATCHATLA